MVTSRICLLDIRAGLQVLSVSIKRKEGSLRVPYYNNFFIMPFNGILFHVLCFSKVGEKDRVIN